MFGFFRKPRTSSSAVAKDRLQILLAHERAGRSRHEYIDRLKRDILEVIAKHVAVDRESVDIKVDRNDEFSTLEINIELPEAEQLDSRTVA